MRNQTHFGEFFGGFIAYVLLGLYVLTVFYITWEVWSCTPGSGCQTQDFTGGTTYVVTTIGGLISALVVSKLTLTDPNAGLSIKSARGIRWKPTLELTYLVFWLITGLAAVVVGVMIRPNISSTLSDIGTNWLGIAVASGFAYFGLRPPAANTPINEPNENTEAR